MSNMTDSYGQRITDVATLLPSGRYAAPETLHGYGDVQTMSTSEADIYSTAMVILEVCSSFLTNHHTDGHHNRSFLIKSHSTISTGIGLLLWRFLVARTPIWIVISVLY